MFCNYLLFLQYNPTLLIIWFRSANLCLVNQAGKKWLLSTKPLRKYKNIKFNYFASSVVRHIKRRLPAGFSARHSGLRYSLLYLGNARRFLIGGNNLEHSANHTPTILQILWNVWRHVMYCNWVFNLVLYCRIDIPKQHNQSCGLLGTEKLEQIKRILVITGG